MSSSSTVLWRERDGATEPRSSAPPREHERAGSAARSSPPEVASYYPQFDWLRIALAAGVMLWHAKLIAWPQAGNFCVQIFFALSGWLIGAILLRTPRAGMTRFYFQRGTRIWIPYALAFALLFAVSMLRDRPSAKYYEFVFYKATFVYNLFGPSQLAAFARDMPLGGTGNHFWSICAEEQFYLCAPLLLVFLPRVGRSLWLWGALLAVSLWIDVYASISVGVMAAIAQQRFGDLHLDPRVRFGLGAFVLIVAPLLFTDTLPYAQTVPWLSIAIVLLLAQPGKKGRIAGWLGGVSYPLYLNHWIGLFVGHSLMKRFGVSSPVVDGVVGSLLALLVAGLLYQGIDRQILARRGGWYSERAGKRFALAAYALTVVGLLGAAAIRYGHLTPQPEDAASAPPARHAG